MHHCCKRKCSSRRSPWCFSTGRWIDYHDYEDQFDGEQAPVQGMGDAGVGDAGAGGDVGGGDMGGGGMAEGYKADAATELAKDTGKAVVSGVKKAAPVVKKAAGAVAGAVGSRAKKFLKAVTGGKDLTQAAGERVRRSIEGASQAVSDTADAAGGAATDALKKGAHALGKAIGRGITKGESIDHSGLRRVQGLAEAARNGDKDALAELASLVRAVGEALTPEQRHARAYRRERAKDIRDDLYSNAIRAQDGGATPDSIKKFVKSSAAGIKAERDRDLENENFFHENPEYGHKYIARHREGELNNTVITSPAYQSFAQKHAPEMVNKLGPHGPGAPTRK